MADVLVYNGSGILRYDIHQLLEISPFDGYQHHFLEIICYPLQ